MRIESLEIHNFKNIRHLKMDHIPDLVVVAGPNGSGKTAVFDAIRVFKETWGGYSFTSERQNYSHQLIQKIGPVITVGETTCTISATIGITDDERHLIGLPEGHDSYLRGHVIIQRIPANGYERASPRPDAHDEVHLEYLFGSLYRQGSGMGVLDHIGPDRRFNDSPITNIDLSATSLENDLRRLVWESEAKFDSLIPDLLQMYFIDLQEQHNGVSKPKGYINGIKTIFRDFLPNIEFVGAVSPSDYSGPTRILVRTGGVEHDVSRMSSGQKEVLMTYTHLEKLRPSSSVILFDEPELHLHPTLQRRVITHLQNVIARGHNQIWVITHAEEIVDTTDYRSLFAMTGTGDPAILPVTRRADKINLLEQLGASIGQQLAAPRIIFVEGDSDKDLLPLLCGELPVGAALVPAGNKRVLMRVAGATTGLLEEVIRDGTFYWIRDHDVEDDPALLDQLQEKHGEHFHTWARYHVENYLLDEEAIYRVLADEPGIAAPPSPEEVGRQLRAIADEQRDDVLARHLEATINHALLRQRLTINVPEGVEQSLYKAAQGRLADLIKQLDSDNVRNLYKTEKAKLDQCWEADWKTLCIGRNVLQTYQKRHARQFSYILFRNHVAREIRELGRVSAEILAIMQAASSGTPLRVGASAV